MATKMHVEVYGLLCDMDFVRARCCAEDLYKNDPSRFTEPHIEGMLEFEWNLFIDEKRKELRGDTWQFNEKVIIFIIGELIGGPDEFVLWAEEKCNFQEYRPQALYLTLTEAGYKNHLNSQKHDYVFMDIRIGDEQVGRLVFELFSDIVPRTCENFRALCTGEKGVSETTDHKLHYKDSLFHRIVPNGWIQGGDIYYGRGNGGESIYGPVFEDENFAVQYTRRGMLGMANKGRHTNASQFFITLQNCEWMHTKYVCFGQIIEGTETLKRMESQTTMNERPNTDIRVSDCGVCVYEF